MTRYHVTFISGKSASHTSTHSCEYSMKSQLDCHFHYKESKIPLQYDQRKPIPKRLTVVLNLCSPTAQRHSRGNLVDFGQRCELDVVKQTVLQSR